MLSVNFSIYGFAYSDIFAFSSVAALLTEKFANIKNTVSKTDINFI